MTAASKIADPRRDKREADKRAKRLRRQVGQAIEDFNMIEAGDRVLVAPASHTHLTLTTIYAV